GVRLFQLGKIGDRVEMAAVDELLDLRLRDVFDVGFPGVQHPYLFGVGVESRDLMASLGKTQRQGKSDIATSHDTDFKVRALEKFRSSICWHRRKKLLIFSNYVVKAGGPERPTAISYYISFPNIPRMCVQLPRIFPIASDSARFAWKARTGQDKRRHKGR